MCFWNRVLHRQFAVILRVVSSKNSLIDTDSFNQYCLDAYQTLVMSFPWATIPPSVHRILAHSAERMELNDSHGLGELSEEGLECMHKLVRRFRSMLARKTNLADNLRDVFMHLWLRSDPKIRSQARTLQCSLCGGIGHTKRSCPTRNQTCLNSYDAEVQEFFVSD